MPWEQDSDCLSLRTAEKFMLKCKRSDTCHPGRCCLGVTTVGCSKDGGTKGKVAYDNEALCDDFPQFPLPGPYPSSLSLCEALIYEQGRLTRCQLTTGIHDRDSEHQAEFP